MRFHIVGLPHTELTPEYSWCAYTGKVQRLGAMLESLGHDVYTYAGVDYTDYVGENIDGHWSPTDPYWTEMNERVAAALRERAEPGDYLCLIMGRCQEQLATLTHDMGLMVNEFGVGYQGVFAPYRCFESYAWMHAVYGANSGGGGAVMSTQGKFYDAVIPNSYDLADFPEGAGGDYLLYMGRLTELKGLHIVADIGKRTNVPIVVAGEGDLSLLTPDMHYVGLVGPEERARLMGGARALLVPTLYLEPFGGVHAEARLTGTPVITTDWGVFPESVEQGVDGYRCRTLRQFLAATEAAGNLDRQQVRNRAIGRFSTDAVRYQYDRWYSELESLKGRGWYTGV